MFLFITNLPSFFSLESGKIVQEQHFWFFLCGVYLLINIRWFSLHPQFWPAAHCCTCDSDGLYLSILYKYSYSSQCHIGHRKHFRWNNEITKSACYTLDFTVLLTLVQILSTVFKARLTLSFLCILAAMMKQCLFVIP